MSDLRMSDRSGKRFNMEWKCQETFAYYLTSIEDYDVEKKRVLLSFENDWKPPLWVDEDEEGNFPIRPTPNPFKMDAWEIQEGEMVEAKARSEENEPFSWWLCQIQCIKNDFFLIKFKGWPEQYNEILKKDMMRPNNKRKHLTRKVFFKDTYQYPESLNDWMREKPGKIMELASTKGCHKFEIRPDFGDILMIGTRKSCKKINAWLQLLCAQESELKSLQHEMRVDSDKLEQAQAIYQEAYTETFTIHQDLVKYVIGRGGKNISNAKKIPDILDIKIHENRESPYVEIIAQSEEAIEEARDLVEIVRKMVSVPEREMGRIIGVRGSVIQDIKTKSGVLFIRSMQMYIDSISRGNRKKNPGMVERLEQELEEFSSEKGWWEDDLLDEFDSDEPRKTLLIVGTKDSVETATRLLIIKLKHLRVLTQKKQEQRRTQQEYRRVTGVRDYQDRQNNRRNNNRRQDNFKKDQNDDQESQSGGNKRRRNRRNNNRNKKGQGQGNGDSQQGNSDDYQGDTLESQV